MTQLYFDFYHDEETTTRPSSESRGSPRRYRELTPDEYKRIERTVADVLKKTRFVELFRVCKMDRDDVAQEARISGWRHIARDDVSTPLSDRFRMLRGRIIWDLKDLLRVKTGERRSDDVKETFKAIELAKPIAADVAAESTVRLSDDKPNKNDLKNALYDVICDAIDEARKL